MGSKGFTLVELLIVLLLVSILAGGVIVSFSGRQDRHALQIATKDLVVAFRCAGASAKQTGNVHRVRFDSSFLSFWLEEKLLETQEFTRLGGRAGIERKLPKNVRISRITFSGVPADPLPKFLLFGPNGNGFSGNVVLRNRAGEELTVEVIGETGQSHVVD